MVITGMVYVDIRDYIATHLRFRWDGLRDVEPGLAARAKAFSQRH